MKTILIFIFLLNFLTTFACKCIEVSFKNEFKRSEIIVSGKIIEILNPIQKIDTLIDNDGKILIREPLFGYAKRMLISRHYKGKTISDTITIAGDNSNCELYLELGKTFLIYGYLKNNTIITSQCTRSAILENHKDLKYLEKRLRRKKKNPSSRGYEAWNCVQGIRALR